MKNFVWILILFPSFLWGAHPDWAQRAVPDGACLKGPLADPKEMTLDHLKVLARQYKELNAIFLARREEHGMMLLAHAPAFAAEHRACAACTEASIKLGEINAALREAPHDRRILTARAEATVVYRRARHHWEVMHEAARDPRTRIAGIEENIQALYYHCSYLHCCAQELASREEAAESRARAEAEAHRRAAEETRAARAAQRREREEAWLAALKLHSEAERARAARNREERARRRSRGDSVWSE